MPSTATQSPPQAHGVPDMTWERLGSGLVHNVIMGARPWACVAAEIGAAYAAHAEWGHMPALPWATAALTLATTGLTAWSWLMSRLPSVGRAHTAVTAAAAGTWLTVSTITGPFQEVTGGAVAIGGVLLSITWMIRNAARRHVASAPQNGHGDRLRAWFSDAADDAGMKGTELHTVKGTAARITAVAELPGGKTAADLVSRIPSIESAAGLPPGTITASASPDRADHAHLVMSDPRVLSQPIPWPGPSAPGASIAEPLRPGVWQDSQPVLYVIVGHHIFMMGASGSGKSMGGGWNLLGEAMTRPDCARVAIDITKGNQTFGPLLPAFHRYERDIVGVRDYFGALERTLQDRTDAIAARGLQKWEPGCGLSYLLTWVEETADVFDKIGEKGENRIINAARALRSAGGTLVFSVQRNTYDQVPTIIRGQMSSMCFGLNDPLDNKYGLSEAQQNAGLNLAEWGIRYPGKAVLDAPTIPVEKITMPLRTFTWGTGPEAAAAMTAHAALYPASAHPVDPITAQVCGSTAAAGTTITGPARATPPSPPARPVVTLAARPADEHQDHDHEGTSMEDDNEPDPVAEALAGMEDPSPDITAQAAAADPDQALAGEPDDARFEFVAGEKMTPEAARAALAELLSTWRASGITTFAPRDMGSILTTTGMGRAWLQARLKEAVEAGQLAYDPDQPGRYSFTDDPATGESR